MEEDKIKTRREFLRSGTRLSLALALGGLGGIAALHASAEKWVWQIDPFKCNQCGRCADECVLSPSAVKCVHAFNICGYCDLCGGYFKPGSNALTSAVARTSALSCLCPRPGILSEEPFFEYRINEDLCIGCAKCVKGCSSFRQRIIASPDHAAALQELQSMFNSPCLPVRCN